MQTPLPQNPLNYLSRFDSRWLLVQTLETEGEAIMIHAEAMENRRIEIANVDGVFDDVVGVIIRRAVADTPFHSTARDPCAEAAPVVISSCADFSLTVNSATKFTAPDDKRIF